MRWWFFSTLLVTACGPSAPPTDGPSLAPVEAPPADKPFVRTEIATATASQREAMRYVADSGEFSVEAMVDGEPLKFSLALDLVAMRVGDVPTLEFPVGFVKLEPLSLASGDAGRDKLVVDTVLRTLGSPIQLFFDVHSVTDMQGRLAEPGSAARGTVLGLAQIDDRQQNVTADVLFERPAEDRLLVEVKRLQLSAEAFALTERLGRLARRMGARQVDDALVITGSFALVRFDGGQLPTFVRTPVTVATVDEIQAKLDAEIDDVEAARARLETQGVDEVLMQGLTPGFLEAVEQARKAQRPKVFDTPSD